MTTLASLWRRNAAGRSRGCRLTLAARERNPAHTCVQVSQVFSVVLTDRVFSEIVVFPADGPMVKHVSATVDENLL